MAMKRGSLLALAVVIIVGIIAPLASAAAPRLGSRCPRLGQSSTSNGTKFVCTKLGNTLQWKQATAPTSPAHQIPLPQPTGQSTVQAPSEAPVENVVSPDPISTCQVPEARVNKTQPNNVGFPLTLDEIPTTGTVKAVFIPIDFSDAIGVGDPFPKSNAIAEKMNSWFKYWSNGRFSISAQHSHLWFHANESSSNPEYSGLEHPNTNDPNQLSWNQAAQRWIDLTGSSYDFTGVKAIFFDFPPGVKIAQGTQGRNVLLQTRQGPIQAFFNVTGQYWYSSDAGATAQQKQDNYWSFYIHEMLHSMGMALHAPGNGFPTSIGTQQTGTPEGFSGTLDPWSLFLLGWLDESQIFCSSLSHVSNQRINLTPLDIEQPGRKTAIIALDNHQALVVMSRRPSGWSSDWPADASGIMVYRVDTTLDNDRSHESSGDNGNDPTYSKWAYFIPPDNTSIDPFGHVNFRKYIAHPGQTFTTNGVRILFEQSQSTDVIQLSKISS
jgi:hypothetical protein